VPFTRHHRRTQCRVSVPDIDWYGIYRASLLLDSFSCWIHFPDTGPTVASNWAQLKRQEENQSWEDGADESDDMVVWASHACKSLMAAAIADDRRSDIKS
jgi:hypothetical protein